MARTALTVLTSARFGGSILDIAPAAVNNTDGNFFSNTGSEKLVVVNGSGGSLTVTVALPSSYRSLDGLATAKTHVVLNSKTAVIGPFPPDMYNQTNGVVNVDWSTGTSVTASVVSHIA